MSKKKLILIIACVLAAAILITGLVLALKALFKNKPSDVDDPNTPPAQSEPVVPNSDATVTVGSVEGLAEDFVTVPVTITKNPGIMGVQFSFDYDQDVLKYAGCVQGDILTDYDVNDVNGVVNFVSYADVNVFKDGTLLNLKFQIKEGAPKGDSTIKVIYDGDCMANYEEESIVPTVVEGKVTVK